MEQPEPGGADLQIVLPAGCLKATTGDTTPTLQWSSDAWVSAAGLNNRCTACWPLNGQPLTATASPNHRTLAVKIDKETHQPTIYPIETFRQVVEVNLIAPVYWALEMVARVAEDRVSRGQLLARLRLIALQHEIGQQRLQPIGLQFGDRLRVIADLKTAEQLDTQHGYTA